MKLIDGESILIESGPDGVGLSTHRVYHESRFKFASIMLEDLTSCRVDYEDKIIWAILAVLTLAAGVVASLAEQSPVWALVGGVFAFMFFMKFRGSRRAILVLACGSDSIESEILGADMSKSTDFIHAVQSAKNARYILLAQSPRATTAGE